MKYFHLLISFFIVQFSFADAWPEMSKAEAEAVVAELAKNPYIFDYCDCCDFEKKYPSSIYFMKVGKAEIVPCELDAGCYYVELEIEILAKVAYDGNGPDVNQLSEVGTMRTNDQILMNYRWVFNPTTKKATPFFKIVPYNYYDFEKKSCKEEFAFPTPEQLKTVSNDKGYKKWYNANIAK